MRRRPQRGADDLTEVQDEPELVLSVELRAVTQRPCEPQDQVVACLVGEQQPLRSLEKLHRVGELDDLHATIVTSAQPLYTRLGSA